MIKIITATERHEARVDNWLTSFYLFSFADYYDERNVQFGPLRVFNDDYVSPKSGFPLHPHADMEILTIVMAGEITHKDSLGNESKVAAGQVQRMTAGTGITHSETNNTDDVAHLLQLWFLPNKRGLAPSYETMDLDFLDTDNKLLPVATGQKVLEDVVFINSNSTVYYATLGSGKNILFQTYKIRKALIYMIKGRIVVNGVEADEFDQMRLEEQEVIKIHASADAAFVMVDVPAVEANY